MKKRLMISLICLGLGGQAFSMGHPHNLFAARKQLKGQKSQPTVCSKERRAVQLNWQSTQRATTPSLSSHRLAKAVIDLLLP